MSVSSVLAPVAPGESPVLSHNKLARGWEGAARCPIGEKEFKDPCSTPCGHSFSIEPLRDMCAMRLIIRRTGYYLADDPSNRCQFCQTRVQLYAPNRVLTSVVDLGRTILACHKALSQAHQDLMMESFPAAHLEKFWGTKTELIGTRPTGDVTDGEVTFRAAVKKFESLGLEENPYLTDCVHPISWDTLQKSGGAVKRPDGTVYLSKLDQFCKQCDARICHAVTDHALKGVIAQVQAIVRDYLALADRHRDLLVQSLVRRVTPPAVAHLPEAVSDESKKTALVSKQLPPFPGAKAEEKE